MTTLAASLDSSPLLPGGASDRTVDDPSPEALVAMHADALRLARGRMWTAWWCGCVPLAGILAFARFDRSAFLLVVIVAPLLTWIADATSEWWTVRRSDPLELWRSDRFEVAEDSAGISEHLTRATVARPFVTLSVMLVVLAVTLVQFFGPGVAASLPLAALVKPAVREGEWWRLITAALLHANAMHVSANVAGLGVLGEFVEVYDRRARVGLVFLVGAICGGIASTFAFSATSVGASGGVLALGGYLLGAGVGPSSAPGWLKRRVKRGLWPTAVLGIAGFFFIDNAAHIGGLAAGYAIGLLAKRAARNDNSRLAHALDWAGWLSLVLLACAAAFTTGRLLRAW